MTCPFCNAPDLEKGPHPCPVASKNLGQYTVFIPMPDEVAAEQEKKRWR